MCKVIEFKGKATLTKSLVNTLYQQAEKVLSESSSDRFRELMDELSSVYNQINEYGNFMIDTGGENNSMSPGSILFSIAEKLEKVTDELKKFYEVEVCHETSN